MTHVVLRGETVGELGQNLGELGVDRRAVVALHEVLDDQLPVRRHVVDDPVADVEAADLVAVDGVGVAERAVTAPITSSNDGGSSARHTQA